MVHLKSNARNPQSEASPFRTSDCVLRILYMDRRRVGARQRQRWGRRQGVPGLDGGPEARPALGRRQSRVGLDGRGLRRQFVVLDAFAEPVRVVATLPVVLPGV